MDSTSKNPTVDITFTMTEFYKIRENLSLKCKKMTSSELKEFLKNSAEKVLKELKK